MNHPKRILLVFPRIPDRYLESICPPFGLLEINSYLNKHGYQCSIYDRNLQENTIHHLLKKIKNEKIEFIALSSMSIQYKDAEHILAVCRIIDVKIICGGDYFSVFPEKALNLGCHYVIIGDGEIAIRQILEGLIDCYSVTVGKPLQSLDEIPLPDLDDIKSVEIDPYKFYLRSSKGCPYKCTFCSAPPLKNRCVFSFSVDYIKEYVENIILNLNYTTISFVDNIFTFDMERAIHLLETIKKYNLRISEIFVHPKHVSFDLFKELKKLGVRSIQFGCESGSNEILKNVKKGFNIDELADCINLANRASLITEGLFILGNIGENSSTLQATEHFLKKIHLDKTWFSFAVPVPGSEFYNLAGEYGTILTYDWEKYTNKEIVFVPKDLDKSSILKYYRLFNQMNKKSSLSVLNKLRI